MKEIWIQPANVKTYNLVEHFSKNKTIFWKKSKNIYVGDTFLIYLAAPYKEIKYKCKVINDNVSKEEIIMNNALYATKKEDLLNQKYIEVELICEYPEQMFGIEELKKNYFGQVQQISRIDRRTKDYMNKKCKGGNKLWQLV